MKTILPDSISTIEEAKKLLLDLHNNGEAFHPEDDATQMCGNIFTHEEGTKLNKLMDDIYNLPGNDGKHDNSIEFCPALRTIVRYIATQTIVYDFEEFIARQPRNLKLVEWLETLPTPPANQSEKMFSREEMEALLSKLDYYRKNELLSDEQMKPINYAINTVTEFINK